MAPTKRPAAAGKFASGVAKKGKKQNDKNNDGAEEGKAGLNQQVVAWKAGVGEHDDPEDPQSRDKGKAVKFAKMKENNALPPHVLWMYESVPKGMPVRQYRTSLINRLFNRTSQGNYQLAGHQRYLLQAGPQPLQREVFQAGGHRTLQEHDLARTLRPCDQGG